MLVVKIPIKTMTDMFTSDILGMHECIEGLPKKVKLVDVQLLKEENMILYLFEDEQIQITDIFLKFKKLEDK